MFICFAVDHGKKMTHFFTRLLNVIDMPIHKDHVSIKIVSVARVIMSLALHH